MPFCNGVLVTQRAAASELTVIAQSAITYNRSSSGFFACQLDAPCIPLNKPGPIMVN